MFKNYISCIYPINVVSQMNAKKRSSCKVVTYETVRQAFNVVGPLKVLLQLEVFPFNRERGGSSGERED